VIRGLDGICPTMGSGRAPWIQAKGSKGITSGDGCQAIMTEDCRDFKNCQLTILSPEVHQVIG